MSGAHGLIKAFPKKTLNTLLRVTAGFLLIFFLAALASLATASPVQAEQTASAPTLTTTQSPTATATSGSATASGDEVSIIFTHDMHSHFDPERFMDGNQIAERGGFARLATAIANVKSTYPNSFLLDAGDFSMGTPYQTIFSSDAAELRMLGQLGYDATTLGNHEFDYRTQGLTKMLTVALDSGDKLPLMTAANIDWDATLADASLKDDAQALQNVLQRYGNADYQIIERGGVKIAVFGIIGKNAIADAPLAGLHFKDPIETAKAVVAKIEAEASPDMIVCLSHSGTNPDPKASEDELLAKAVPDIDVIISGHTHTLLEEPIVVGNTYIVSCGSYTYYLGHVTLARDGARYKVTNYELIPIRENIAMDPTTEASILDYRALVDQKYFAQFGYKFDQVLANSPFSFTPLEQIGAVQGENTMGDLITDGYIYAVKQAEGTAYKNVDVAIVPNGVIRSSFVAGDITVADAYNVLSLGIGPDNVPGYPLVSIYLTGKELKTAAEVDISISPMMPDARLFMSGLTYTYNPHRLILNRVTSVQLLSQDGTVTDLNDNQLYRVVGDLYSCQMLGQVESRSFGLLKIVPKDSAGTAITNFEDYIIYNNGQELREWASLAEYLSSFKSVNGTPQIPGYYNMLHQRKTEVDSRSPIELLKNPNKIFFIVVGAIVLVLAIIAAIVLLIVHIVRRVRRKRRKLAAIEAGRAEPGPDESGPDEAEPGSEPGGPEPGEAEPGPDESGPDEAEPGSEPGGPGPDEPGPGSPQ